MTAEPLDVHRVLFADDGDEYWRRRMHSRCNPRATIDREPAPILCPWCEEFDGPSEALTEARRTLAKRKLDREAAP